MNKNPGAILPTVVLLTLAGCGEYDPAHLNAVSTKVDQLDGRVQALERARHATPATPTVMWVQNPGTAPRASAYYATKEECAETAGQWGLIDEKNPKIISTDPWIIQSEKRRDAFGNLATLVVSCLPQGVAPFVK